MGGLRVSFSKSEPSMHSYTTDYPAESESGVESESGIVTTSTHKYPTKINKQFKAGMTTKQAASMYSNTTKKRDRHHAVRIARVLSLDVQRFQQKACSALLARRDVWATIDSGASKGLIGKGEAEELGMDLPHSNNSYILSTANGITETTELVSKWFPNLEFPVEALLLDKSPF